MWLINFQKTQNLNAHAPWSKLSWLSCWRIQLCTVLNVWHPTDPRGQNSFSLPFLLDLSAASSVWELQWAEAANWNGRWVVFPAVIKPQGLSPFLSFLLMTELFRRSLSHIGQLPKGVLSHSQSEVSEILTDERRQR